MDRLRRLLTPPGAARPRVWPALAAAAFAAVSALSLALAMILAPPTVVQHPLEGRSVADEAAVSPAG